MRVVDLDRDMSDVIPTGTSVDSEFLFRRMEEETFAALPDLQGRKVLDSAAGIGQDDRRLAGEGGWIVGAEPSQRMTALAQLEDEKDPPAAGQVLRIRAWSERLPFDSDSFDGVFCKGALDHFDDPLRCIAEMARVTAPNGSVVLAVANFGSLGCRCARLAQRWRRKVGSSGRRHYDVPSDHFTRYDGRLLRAHAERHFEVERFRGVSLLWGVRPWARILSALPRRWADRLLGWADRIAARFPGSADVIIVAGSPR